MADLRPADDLSIPADERLYIRIYPAPDAVCPVGDGHLRPNSGGTKGRHRDEPLSVDLGSICTPDETRDRGTTPNFFHVAVLIATEIRQIGLGIARDPIMNEDPPNPAHGLILGSRADAVGNLQGGLTKGENEKLARKARIIILTPQ